MYWGQFVTVVGRDTYVCVADCGEPINPGEFQYNLVNRARATGKLFTRRLHRGCFDSYIDAVGGERRLEIQKRRKERPGRVRMELTEEQRLRRGQLIRAISEGKERLARAYRKKNTGSATTAKAAIARYLSELTVEQKYKFRLGEELLEYIHQGYDPYIKPVDLQAVDWEDNLEIVELLTRTEAKIAPQPVVDTRTPEQQYQDALADLEESRKGASHAFS